VTLTSLQLSGELSHKLPGKMANFVHDRTNIMRTYDFAVFRK